MPLRAFRVLLGGALAAALQALAVSTCLPLSIVLLVGALIG